MQRSSTVDRVAFHHLIVFSCVLCHVLFSRAAHADELPNSDLRINEIQFVGSHNSYKTSFPVIWRTLLGWIDRETAEGLDYAHIPLADQLDLGLRNLEIDIFNDVGSTDFPVGHVQIIDMNSNCVTLADCLTQVRVWSDAHPQHVPIWITFNAKDDKIPGLPAPDLFDEAAFNAMDQVIEEVLGDRLIRPQDVTVPQWPRLEEARGKFLLVLDEGGAKRDLYLQNWPMRPMFATAPVGHPAAAVLVINDPLADGETIRQLVSQGYMVRTRADADTREARANDTRRRDAAFASGAQAVSTDFYAPGNSFGTPYVVELSPPVRCNPVLTDDACRRVSP